MAKRKTWFQLTRLHRDDIVQAFDDNGKNVDASSISDEEMERIAQSMVSAWLESGGYWDSLVAAVEEVVGDDLVVNSVEDELCATQ